MATSTLKRKAKGVAVRPVRILAHFKDASEVTITGDFTGWARDQVRLDRGLGPHWHATLLLAPGTYQYRLLVDGDWRDDPHAEQRVPNPFGTQNCILTVT